MKKLIILLLFTGVVSAQENILEFTTTRSSSDYGNVEMNIKFELYNDSLIMRYLDKSTIKAMAKAGQKSYQNMPYSFELVKNNVSSWYEYQDDENQIRVMHEGTPNKSVTIQSRNAFSGEASPKMVFY